MSASTLEHKNLESPKEICAWLDKQWSTSEGV